MKRILLALTILGVQPIFAGQTASKVAQQITKTDPRAIAAAIVALTALRDYLNSPERATEDDGVPRRDPKEKSKTRLAYEKILFAKA